MSKKRGSNQFAAYSADLRYQKNKERKLARHMKKHPDDSQTAKAVGKVATYSKTTPKKSFYPVTEQYQVRCMYEKKNRNLVVRYTKEHVMINARLHRADNAAMYKLGVFMTPAQIKDLNDSVKSDKSKWKKEKKLKSDIVSAK
jgi:hypothetical protein